MKNKTTQFLNMSLALVSLFCILLFGIQTLCMNLMGEDAIRQLGVFYISGISEQVASHFGTTIELRLSQVEALVDAVPPGRFQGGTPLQIELSYNARSAGFEYLAFYADDGSIHMIYGPMVEPDFPKDLRQAIQGGRYNVCAGKDEDGVPIVLMGVPAVYPMTDGRNSIALVAGFPTSYLSHTLENNIKSSMVEYSIIRRDGSYVLQSQEKEEHNYFERIAKHYTTYNGKKPDQYASELQDALDSGEDYTSEVMISGERWNVYCTTLPNSQWHLLLKISHSAMDETVKILQRRWSFVSIGGCSLIICALLLVFAGYYRLTRQQMYDLNEAKKSADLARLSAERSSRAKSVFLSNMSHDIRTPMNGIIGMTSIAIGSLDNPPRVRSCLKRIHVSSRHLLGLLNDMLDMSMIESGNLTLNMEPVSLRDIMQSIVTIIQPQVQEKEQHLKAYVHNIRHEHVCSDRIRLSQILLNILGNAVKYTPAHGCIEIRLSEEPSPKGDKYIRSLLHIKDNGIGMSPEFQARIFEAFAREDSARVDKELGTGMGMSITKYIVDAMGGTITVDSQKGKGSDFYVAIDMEKTLQDEPDLRLPGKRVLIVDDDEVSNEFVTATLGSIGLKGEAAADPTQALRMIEEGRKKGEDYHVLLLDWDIQDQDGIRIAQELRRAGLGLPVVLLTDGEWDEVEFTAKEAGINGFISKPLFRSSLYYGLRHFVESEDLPPAPQIGSEEIELAGRRILVAEDNELNWEIANELLSDLGMEMDWAENGQICVEKFEQSAPAWYDAVLMDLRMPVMTGFEAARAIRGLDREDAKTIPIIAVSADTFAEDVQKCLDCGMNAHTPKPFDLDEVLRLLRQYLH